jgi:dTDP-4-dehydrorhamnose reductase
MRVLVTGVSGLVGSNVAAVAARESWEVLGCFRDREVEIEGVRTVGFEMANRRACVRAATEFEPDVVVHAAGGVALSRFEREPYIAELDFVGAEHTLAAARAVRARYVLVSCDWVYSGYRPAGCRFTESDVPEPVNAYGRAKVACEEAAMRANVRWLITRPGEVYGVNVARPVRADDGARERYVWGRSGAALRVVRRLRGGTALSAPAGLQRSPTYAWDYAGRVCELIAQGCEGIYNMGGPEALGCKEWWELLGARFGCEKGLVREGTNAALLRGWGEDGGVRLPPNTALSDEKARAAIGCAAVAPGRGVELMREQLQRTVVPAESPAR